MVIQMKMTKTKYGQIELEICGETSETKRMAILFANENRVKVWLRELRRELNRVGE